MPNERKRQYNRIATKAHFQEQSSGERKELWKLEKRDGFISKHGMRIPKITVHPSPTGVNASFVATYSEAVEVQKNHKDYNLVRA